MEPLLTRIQNVIEPSLAFQGYGLVRLLQTGGKERQCFQIMIERMDGTPVSLDECAAISRKLSVLLEAEVGMPDSYVLELGSAGIDRPLVKLADYPRFMGHKAKLELQFPLDGRKRFTGDIARVEGETITLTLEDGTEVSFPFAQVSHAKLVLTDKLLAMGKAAREAANQAAEAS
jgi:ribosome maturation factor RimP